MRNRILYSFFCATILSVLILSCQSNEEIEHARYYINGKNAYENHCQNCHGTKGEGLEMLIPPLTDTVFIKDNLNNIASMIKHGISGEMIIHGKIYNGIMPAEAHLTPIEITYIINYIGNSFGNKIGHYSLEQVQKDLKTLPN